jgi:hypothetical protein
MARTAAAARAVAQTARKSKRVFFISGRKNLVPVVHGLDGGAKIKYKLLYLTDIFVFCCAFLSQWQSARVVLSLLHVRENLIP